MSRFRPLPLLLRAQLFQHLAAMEKAGIPADRSFAVLDLGSAARERVVNFQRLYSRGVEPATAGLNSGLFTLFEGRLLRAAFAAGSPWATYQRLASSHATHAAQMAALRARLVLPGLTLLIGLLVGPLPKLVTGELSLGGYAWKTIGPMLTLAVLGMLAVRLHTWFTSGAPTPWRPALEQGLLALPLFGRLHLRRNARDFCESLAMLLQAGVAVFEALPIAVATVDNHQVRADLATILPMVKSGSTLAQGITQLQLVDTTQLFAFVHTGEESGSLPEMLLRHADAESEALSLAQAEIINWLPRVIYACVAIWMIIQLLGKPPGAPQINLSMAQSLL
jgi:general secretion pathway protein F